MNNDPKRECPENCRYLSRVAPFCGYCLPEIMEKLGMRKDKEAKHGQSENEDDGQAGSKGV